ncbi:MAG: hypothetical protein ACREH7_02090, partial [Candidatus Rokuibacteriota bacterium]
WLDVLDGRLNGYRHGGRMNVPFTFKRPAEWRELFLSRGLRTVETLWLGSRWERLVHHPLLFVLDKSGQVDVDSQDCGGRNRRNVLPCLDAAPPAAGSLASLPASAGARYTAGWRARQCG